MPRLSKLEEVKRLRKKGIEAFAAVTPSQILLSQPQPPSSTTSLLPLGGVAHSLTVFCQEDDPYLDYVSDRYGFHNDDTLWDKKIEVALIGDSFAQGACVPAENSLQAQLNARNIPTLSLGSFGNGPLSNLGTIREYLHSMKPQIVFWLHVPNDIVTDLEIEKTSPTLLNYLSSAKATQNLSTKGPEIDSLLKQFLNREEQLRLHSNATLDTSIPTVGTGWSNTPTSFFLLGEVFRWSATLRLKLCGLAPFKKAFDADYDAEPQRMDWDRFFETLAVAKGEVASWGGKLVVVSIADAQMFTDDPSRRLRIDGYSHQLSTILKSLKIDELSVFELLKKKTDRYTYYAPIGPYYGHFNSRGYSFLADQLGKYVPAHQ